MSEKIREGGCLCGALRYEVSGEPLAVAACHCQDCQTHSGSAFSMSMIVRRESFRMVSGETNAFSTTADSGASKEIVFCPRCGTRIYNALSSLPGTFNLKPGTLDDTSWLEPQMHVWTASAQSWVPIPEGVPRFSHNPSGLSTE